MISTGNLKPGDVVRRMHGKVGYVVRRVHQSSVKVRREQLKDGKLGATISIPRSEFPGWLVHRRGPVEPIVVTATNVTYDDGTYHFNFTDGSPTVSGSPRGIGPTPTERMIDLRAALSSLADAAEDVVLDFESDGPELDRLAYAVLSARRTLRRHDAWEDR